MLAQEHLPLGRLRITYTGGPAELGSGRGDVTPTTVVVAAAMAPAPETTAVVRVPWPRNERGAMAGVKSTSYAENVVALAEAVKYGATEAIFENLAGHLCEGTGTNVGYVVDGEVRTPTLASGCLAGVTRALLLEWYDVVEVDEPITVLDSADEIFLMSTTDTSRACTGWTIGNYSARAIDPGADRAVVGEGSRASGPMTGPPRVEPQARSWASSSSKLT